MNLRGRIARPHPRGLPIINLGYNELPYGPTPRIGDAIDNTKARINYYGSPRNDDLRQLIGKTYGLDPEQIICGNGSEELLDVIARNFIRSDDEILISQYGYIQFVLTANRMNARLLKADETDFTTEPDKLLSAISPHTRLIFLANPNNPTGTAISALQICALVERIPSSIAIVIDLAYGEFQGLDYCAKVHALVECHENVLVTRTFSKAFGLAGLRVGWCNAPASMIGGLYAARGMGTVNAMAQAAAIAALQDMKIITQRVSEIVRERDRVANALAGLGISTLPSEANFLLATIDGKGAKEVEALVEYLFDEGGFIINRTRETGLEHFCRFCLSITEHNDRLISTIEKFMSQLA